MMRRTLPFFSGGLVEYHEWHLHEPLLQNYEGWRILDNPKYETKLDAWIDIAGSVRHIDPIIDDPRLTHRQRVCRLYRWALKELQAYLTQKNAHKFNLAYKVVRNRFEKYRYVTDPAACDMMIRESQKYMRDLTCYHYMRYNNSSPWSTYTLANPMFHPDGALVYDHWTHPDVMWYDDAKLHRWSGHNPMYAGAGEMSERFGDWEILPYLQSPIWALLMTYLVFSLITFGGFFYDLGEQADNRYTRWNEEAKYSNTAAVRAEERANRMRSATSSIFFDWDRVLGFNVANETVPLHAKSK
jgi:hypothetical protein